jgi:hypothetical protein
VKRPLTVQQAADTVNRSRRQIMQWLKDGMPSQLVLGKRYIAHGDLISWAAENGRRRGPSDTED